MAMAEPTLVQLKRKRTDEPVDCLYLQGAGELPKSKYIRRSKHKSNSRTSEESEQPLQNDAPTISASTQPKENAEKRVFELQRKPVTASRKRKDAEEDIATFVEKKQKNKYGVATNTEQSLPEEVSEPARPLKRPGQGSNLRTPTKPKPQAETDVERKEMEALAAYMHSTALSDLGSKPPTKHTSVSAPKLSGARSQALHRQRAVTNGSVSGMDLDDEDSYVYETYILAPSIDMGAVQVDELGPGGSVGYLVITDDDRSLWETYLEDDGSEGDWDSEEDDENAENYYGAEYPEDEELTDDENKWRGHIIAPRGAPADEEWDEYTGEYSDEEEVIKNGEVPGRFRHLEMGLSHR